VKEVERMIEYKKEERIAIIIINRPETRGALNVQDHIDLYNTLLDFRNDDELWVGIITGTGEKAFCSGADIKDTLPALIRKTDKPWEIPGPALRGLGLWKPLIGAINGLALGGGLELALNCDIRIASNNAKFGFPEVTVGLFPGGGGTQRLPKIVGLGLAAELILTGKIIDAQEAYRIGLVNKIVSTDELMPTARELAEAICRVGPLAVRAAKEAMILGTGMSVEDGLRFEYSLFQHVLSTKDFEEGIAAFLGGRKPRFEGK